MFFRSLIWGLLGACLAGLIVAVIGFAVGISHEMVAAISTPMGAVLGMLGFGYGWARQRADVGATIRQRRR
jgi:hypothetical protein